MWFFFWYIMAGFLYVPWPDCAMSFGCCCVLCCAVLCTVLRGFAHCDLRGCSDASWCILFVLLLLFLLLLLLLFVQCSVATAAASCCVSVALDLLIYCLHLYSERIIGFDSIHDCSIFKVCYLHVHIGYQKSSLCRRLFLLLFLGVMVLRGSDIEPSAGCPIPCQSGAIIQQRSIPSDTKTPLEEDTPIVLCIEFSLVHVAAL